MHTKSIIQQNLRHLIKVIPRGETGIAERVGSPITQIKLSNAVHGKRHLTPTEARAIEFKFGIPDGWLRDYDLEKVYGLLREIADLCSDGRRLRVVHRLLRIALENAPSRKQPR